jgi:hypothetical protein
MRRYVAALAIAAAGCAPAVPQTISVDPSLPEGVHVAVARAVDAVCAEPRLQWCPELLLKGEAEVRAAHWATEFVVGGERPGAAAKNNGRDVIVSANLLAAGESAADFWAGSVLHELMHYGIDGHVDDSALMAAEHDYGAVPHVLDDAAVAAWCEQQGC